MHQNKKMEEPTKRSFQKLPTFLAIAPIATLGIAIAYLQGYWGYLGIFVLPYLSFNEMLAYAVAPLMVVAVIILGMGVGAIQGFTQGTGRPGARLGYIPSAVIGATGEIGLVAITLMAFFYSIPGKWIGFTLAAFSPVLFLTLLALTKLRLAHRGSLSAIYIAIALLLYVATLGFSFGVGDAKAQLLATKQQATVDVDVSGEIFRTKLVGKVSSYNFFLGPDGKVTQYPEASIRRIIYLR